MDDDMNWAIERAGRAWTGPEGLAKLERLPGRLELVRGKLCFHESERRALLAGLLENVGIDEVLTLGDLKLWREALSAREAAERASASPNTAAAPQQYWNCRVIETALPDGETWYAVHEVHYENGRPRMYTEQPTTVDWSSEDGADAGYRRLEKFQEALRQPTLKASDFES